MTKIISLLFLVAGVALIAYGVSASDSIGSSFSRFFTGSPTDKTIWLLLGGVAALIIGLGGLFRSSKTS